MTRSIARTVLTTLALVLLFAGSFNLSRIKAQDEALIEDGGGDAVAVSECEKYTGCKGGPNLCGVLHYPNGPDVECGMK
jgi:hypothetical protein